MLRSLRIPIIGLAAALAAAGGAAVLAAPAAAAVGCQVTYTTNEWTTSPGQGGFGAAISVRNLGDPLTSWTLRFTYPGSQQVTLPGWGAAWSQSGAEVTGPNMPWNGNLGTGASTSIGFNGTWSGSNPAPTSFSLNNVVCTGSTTTPPTNQPPRVSITSPPPGATFVAPATITVDATATDQDGTVARVDFALGSMRASDTTAPYSATFPNVAAGTYALSATATDNQGGVGVLDPIAVTVTGPSTGGAAPALHVSGNRLLTAAGATYRLLGVNRSGGEFACIQGNGMWDGPMDQASITAMRTWKVRAVRVPLNEECWLGTASVPGTGASGATYQQNVRDYVNLLVTNGITPIVEMHWNFGQYGGAGAGCSEAIARCQKPMPDAGLAPQFWTGVANAFKGNDAVVLDLFNEPFPDIPAGNTTAGWTCFRDGGTCPGIGYQVAGFQSLVNAVRGTGATNVIMVGGLTWSNNIAQWLQFRPSDPLNNLMAFAHVYNFNACVSASCWDSQWAPVAAQVPLTISEIGENTCAHGFVDQVMSWADAHGVGYLGWTWNTWPCNTGPALITDYAGTPTAFGQGIRDHLAVVSN
jgi:endoglucanase